MKQGLLLSGGMDSIALAWWKKPSIAFTINYGQLAAAAEIEAAAAICRTLNIQHEIISIDCRTLGSGDMTGVTAHPLAPASDWWPYRNQLLITLAAMKAITFGVNQLIIGTVKTDNQHQDGTVEFVSAINQLVIHQEGRLEIDAPAIHLSTTELIRLSGIPREQLIWAHSCHKANTPCGNCRGCNKYAQCWQELDNELD